MLILFIVLILGLILFFAIDPPQKINRVGEIMFFCALLALCFLFSSVHLIGRF
jgi:hypothetical protein